MADEDEFEKSRDLHSIFLLLLLSMMYPSLGPLSAPIGVEANAFVATKFANESWPDIQITFIASHPGFDGGTLYKNFLKINTKVRIIMRQKGERCSLISSF